MADLGVGKRDDRLLENQNGAGDSIMHDEGTLCTAPPDPLPDLSGGKTIMSDGDRGSASVGGGVSVGTPGRCGLSSERSRSGGRVFGGERHVARPRAKSCPNWSCPCGYASSDSRNSQTQLLYSRPVRKAELETSKLQKSFLLSDLSAQAAKGNTVRWLPSGRGDAIRRLAAVLC